MAWRHIEEPMYPWVGTIDRILWSMNPPNISGPTLVVASDYSGGDRRSHYDVSVLVCMDVAGSERWEYARREVRRRYLRDSRRMAYKNLADRRRAKALTPFLSAADGIRGLCFAMIVNKAIKHLCLNEGDSDRMREAASLKAKWRDEELEVALRVTHVMSCLVGGLSAPGQNVYWVSDQDSLLANEARSQDLARLSSSFTSHYAKHTLGELGIGTTALDEGDRLEEDITAVADLVAGALAETTNRLAETCKGPIPRNLAIEHPTAFLPKAGLIADWFWLGGKSILTKVAVLFERQRDGMFSVSQHTMVRE
jgi:hypothetical protein